MKNQLQRHKACENRPAENLTTEDNAETLSTQSFAENFSERRNGARLGRRPLQRRERSGEKSTRSKVIYGSLGLRLSGAVARLALAAVSSSKDSICTAILASRSSSFRIADQVSPPMSDRNLA